MLVLSGLLARSIAVAADTPVFEFKSGDRVVLLGGTFVERLQSYGYLETLITSSTEGVTFRNLGWSGDDVWGTARAVFGTQQDGFKRLIEDVRLAKPSVILVAYGANEAFAGKPELPRFQAGLETLLDRLAETGARLVLISPPRHEDAGPGLPSPAGYNRSLQLYSEAIRQLAGKRQVPYSNLYNPIESPGRHQNSRRQDRDRLTDDGLHFTPYGNWRVAPHIASKLGVRPVNWKVDIDIGENAYDATGTTLAKLAARPEAVRFVATDRVLPYCPPPPFSPRGAAILAPHAVLRIRGLAEGTYGLRIDEIPAIMADHKQWAAGVHVNLGQYTPQVEQLRQTIIKKNRLFFYRYRPQNETYLFLFRKHEQGNNAVEVPQFDKLVAESEEAIATLRIPNERVYQLVKLKPSDDRASAPEVAPVP